jgi:hypothetical protein
MDSYIVLDDRQYIYAALTAFICLLNSYICLMRVKQMSHEYHILPRLRYSVVGASNIVFAGSPWLHEWPGFTGFCLVLAILFSLLSEEYRWNGGAPEYLRKHSKYSQGQCGLCQSVLGGIIPWVAAVGVYLHRAEGFLVKVIDKACHSKESEVNVKEESVVTDQSTSSIDGGTIN